MKKGRPIAFLVSSPRIWPIGSGKLWEEFEARETPESLLANSLDRLQPILNNFHSGGKSWLANGIRRGQVRERNRIVADGAPDLWAYIEDLLQRAVDKGMLKD